MRFSRFLKRQCFSEDFGRGHAHETGVFYDGKCLIADKSDAYSVTNIFCTHQKSNCAPTRTPVQNSVIAFGKILSSLHGFPKHHFGIWDFSGRLRAKDTASQPVDGHKNYQGLQDLSHPPKKRNGGAADKDILMIVIIRYFIFTFFQKDSSTKGNG